MPRAFEIDRLRSRGRAIKNLPVHQEASMHRICGSIFDLTGPVLTLRV